MKLKLIPCFSPSAHLPPSRAPLSLAQEHENSTGQSCSPQPGGAPPSGLNFLHFSPWPLMQIGILALFLSPTCSSHKEQASAQQMSAGKGAREIMSLNTALSFVPPLLSPSTPLIAPRAPAQLIGPVSKCQCGPSATKWPPKTLQEKDFRRSRDSRANSNAHLLPSERSRQLENIVAANGHSVLSPPPPSGPRPGAGAMMKRVWLEAHDGLGERASRLLVVIGVHLNEEQAKW